MTQTEDRIQFDLEYQRKRSTDSGWPLWCRYDTEDQAWASSKTVGKQNPQYEFRVVKATRTVLEPKREFEAGKTYRHKSLDYRFTVEFVSPKTGVASGYAESGRYFSRTPDWISEWVEVE